jgi:hypothetical protein
MSRAIVLFQRWHGMSRAGAAAAPPRAAPLHPRGFRGALRRTPPDGGPTMPATAAVPARAPAASAPA